MQYSIIVKQIKNKAPLLIRCSGANPFIGCYLLAS